MSPRVTFMFSGQGSHYYGMARPWLAHDVFAAEARAIDGLFMELGVPSILAELYHPARTPADVFDDLRLTHPAIALVELALCNTLAAEGIQPDMVLGASMGEFAAAYAAGVLTLEQVVQAVVEQVSLVVQRCPEGRMVAVIAHPTLMDEQPEVFRNVDLAAVNHDSHFVASGLVQDILRAEQWLGRERIPFQRLAISYPFHSACLEPLRADYMATLARMMPSQPQLPLLSCASADIVAPFDMRHLWRMVRDPIRFKDTIRRVEAATAAGDEPAEEALYLDLGPSGTLANFVQRAHPADAQPRALALLNPFTDATVSLDAAKQACRRQTRGRISVVKGSRPMKGYLFPGQGSQARGMGRELFAEFPALVDQASDILGYSLRELCVEDPKGQLDQTRYSQPALFVVNALSYLHAMQSQAEAPAFLAGHSLGEYNALCAAGAFDFATGLRIVRQRAALMAEAGEGAMAALVGLSGERVRELLDTDASLRELDLANFNGAGQYIVSGPREAVLAAGPAFSKAGASLYHPLRVTGAFHSRYMAAPAKTFRQYLSELPFRSLQTPVIANVTGRPYGSQSIAAMLSDQLLSPVRWDLTIEYLLDQGVELSQVGPGTVLTRLLDKVVAERSSRRPAAPAIAARSASAPTSGAVRLAAAVESNELQRARSPAPGAGCLLGSEAFRAVYGTKYAYACGAMYRGIASVEHVTRAGRAGILAFYGTGGLTMSEIEAGIRGIQAGLRPGAPHGVNLVHDASFSSLEDDSVDLFMQLGVTLLEASAFTQMTPALVRYRLAGIRRSNEGSVVPQRRLIAKVSRPEVAELFLSPPPEGVVRALVDAGRLTREEASLAGEVLMSDDICVEGDSGGHTDRGNPLVLVPGIMALRDSCASRYRFAAPVRIGCAGGIGTPRAVAAAFMLGADFVLTGSINLCTVEAGTSDLVKDMLERINVQDTSYAPAGDMFELGAQVQVLRRGVLFPARARKLFELYRQHESLDEISPDVRLQLEQRYFGRSIEDVYRETREYFMRRDPRQIEKAERDAKHKMALVFRWYLGQSQRFAAEGIEDRRVDFQVHCGPALGAFNQWVRGTAWESWRNRHVDEIAQKLMDEAAVHFSTWVAPRTGGLHAA